MEEALNFLLGKPVCVNGIKSSGSILFSGNVAGTYHWLDMKFNYADVKEIVVSQSRITIYLKRQRYGNHYKA